jgi:import inner membrane translocase subunit TIM22
MAFNGDADPNARLGVHVADLSAETPPNPFLFPRSLLHFHREGSFYPFLPAYPPAFLETQQPNPILESCAGKFFMSAAMGAFIY